MAYLNFHQEELVNLEYSLTKEILATNRAGGYLSTTLIGCNTRKYHGLLVLPIEEFGGDKHVLLSSLDETVIQHGCSFNLGIHKYAGGVYEPKGHKYCVEATCDPVYSLTYRVGGVILKKEIVLVHDTSQLLIRYTLVQATSETLLRLKPFLAFRNVNSLSCANMSANTYYQEQERGISSKLYEGFPNLNMQLSKNNDFVATPDWYNQIEYTEEQNRGYDYKEDLFVPGYFEIPIKQGESVVFSAAIEPVATSGLKSKFEKLVKNRAERDSFESCLKYSANQFIVRSKDDVEVVAGYPWFGAWGRDTFISLPGVTLYADGDAKTCKQAIDTFCKHRKGGLFPNMGSGDNRAYNSIDAPMWFFKCLQEYGKFVGNKTVWKQYSKDMKEILNAYRGGINQYSYMSDNGLIWSKEDGKALTWMDVVYDGRAVTPRGGYAVEINALWYNALCYTLALATEAKDMQFLDSWVGVKELIQSSFVSTFWNQEEGFLADYVDDDGQVMYVRPNQLFACSLEYSPIDDQMKRSVIDIIENMLLTPKGLRTLSPRNIYYMGVYEGSQQKRDEAYHQGTVWPWLLGAYVEANFRLYGKEFCSKANEIVSNFEEDMTAYGVSSIPEVYDGNPPHLPNGAISQAWSVGELLRIIKMIKEYENNDLSLKTTEL